MRKAITVLIVAAVLFIIMILCCGNSTVLTHKEYALKRGDTLWDLYTEYGSSVEWEQWLYEMEKANAGSNLYCAGEKIILLVSEGSGA